jgi:hypothetical protein
MERIYRPLMRIRVVGESTTRNRRQIPGGALSGRRAQEHLIGAAELRRRGIATRGAARTAAVARSLSGQQPRGDNSGDGRSTAVMLMQAAAAGENSLQGACG